jgi:hypothetical protein
MRPVTAEQLPFLLAIIYEMKLDSRDRVVNEFVKLFPEVSKRQVETRLPEVAVKEKRNGVRAWWLKEEYEAMYLEHKNKNGELLGAKDKSGDDAGGSGGSAGAGGGGGTSDRKASPEKRVQSPATTEVSTSSSTSHSSSLSPVLPKPHAPYVHSNAAPAFFASHAHTFYPHLVRISCVLFAQIFRQGALPQKQSAGCQGGAWSRVDQGRLEDGT